MLRPKATPLAGLPCLQVRRFCGGAARKEALGPHQSPPTPTLRAWLPSLLLRTLPRHQRC